MIFPVALGCYFYAPVDINEINQSLYHWCLLWMPDLDRITIGVELINTKVLSAFEEITIISGVLFHFISSERQLI